MRRLAVATILCSAIVLAGCASGGTSTDASPVAAAPSAVPTAQSPAADTEALFAAPLDVELDASASVTQEVGPDGGSLAVTNAEGTQFVLTVPEGALDEMVEITATPTLSLGQGEAGAQSVVMGPSGLWFNAPATIAVTPVEAIPVER